MSSSLSSPVPHPASPGLWTLAWRRLAQDRLAMCMLAVVGLFFILLALSFSGVIARDWDAEVGTYYAPPDFFLGASALHGAASPRIPSLDNPFDPLRATLQQLDRGGHPAALDFYGVEDPLAEDMRVIAAQQTQHQHTSAQARRDTLPLGADKWGHDVLKKTIKGAETSILVGLCAALLATALGTLLGALGGYFGGYLDDALNWFYNVFTSIPYLLLILSVAAVLQQKGVTTIVLILALTGWTGPYRLIRAEYMKHRHREYVWAASAIGASHLRRMFVHIFPNVSHVALVQVSVLVVAFIKSEVILSFLGFGVPVGVVSWGSMLNEAQNELILGKWWQLAAATAAMALLVTAFSLFTDALRDALDPKLK